MMAQQAWQHFIWTVLCVLLFAGGAYALRNEPWTIAVMFAYGMAQHQRGRSE